LNRENAKGAKGAKREEQQLLVNSLQKLIPNPGTELGHSD
jgi:hypothetical protein